MCEPIPAEEQKRFATLAANFARTGHELIRAQRYEAASYYVTRWGLVRELASLDDAEGFLAQIGGAK